VEKWLFSVTLLQGGTFSRTAIEIIKWVKSFGFPHLEAWEGVGEDTERSYSAKSV
jgi:hypothetical protein